MSSDDQRIVVVDYGMGNIGSICNMLKHLGSKAIVSSSVEEISQATKLILPGVGHFDRAMDNISSLGLAPVLRDKALIERVPFLGICLGMQLMCQTSEEGSQPGLSLVEADVKKFQFPADEKMKVPHMGWNYLRINKVSRVLNGLTDPRFYFVHSYFVTCHKKEDVLSYTNYGPSFVSSFETANLVGVQFHPEKSHKYGITLFKNFLDSY